MSSWSRATLSWNGGLTRSVGALILINVAVYVIQALLDGGTGMGFSRLFGLSVGGLMQGKVWQLGTYMFLHGGPFHLLLNMLTLFLIGPEMERNCGRFHFLALYFLSGILGGLGWLALTYPEEGFCLGASGAIFGLLGAFAAMFPNQPITILIFYVLPLTLRAWVLVTGLALIQLLFIVSPGVGNIAYAAHLAGALAGAVYAFAVFRRGAVREWAGSARDGLAARAAADRVRRAEAQRAEVDRLLDKVAAQGLHSLSPAEREQLSRASRDLRNSR
jgi:membrane associated rhomboid family serine protease